MTTLKLDDTATTLDLLPDQYNIYIKGGRYVKVNNFAIRLVNKSNGESVQIFEHGGLKYTDFNGVRYFYFDVPKFSSYEITFHNYDSLIVKKLRSQ